MGITFTAKTWEGIDGRIVIARPTSPYDEAIKKMLETSLGKHNGFITVTMELPHRPRTTGWKSQNHHLRGHEKQIAVFLGLTMSEVHETIKQEFAQWPEKMIKGPHGERFVKLSEAEISLEVCSAAIELCHVWAAHVACPLIEDQSEREKDGGLF